MIIGIILSILAPLICYFDSTGYFQKTRVSGGRIRSTPDSLSGRAG